MQDVWVKAGDLVFLYRQLADFLKLEWVYHEEKLSSKLAIESDLQELQAICKVAL